MMRIKPIFRWFDMWIGMYIDPKEGHLFFSYPNVGNQDSIKGVGQMKDKEKQKERGKIANELIIVIGEMENYRKKLHQLTEKVEQKTRETKEIIKRAEELKGK